MVAALLLMSLGRFDFGQAVQAQVVPDGLGINVHYDAPSHDYDNGENKEMYQVGFRLARIEIDWPTAQSHKGAPYKLSWADEAVSRTVEAGLRPLILLTYNNYKLTGGVSPVSGEGLSGFKSFVAAVVSRYRQYHPLWEIGNEPWHKNFWKPEPDPVGYARLTDATAQTIKRLDPEAYICAGSTSMNKNGYLRAALDAGIISNIDAISIHPYGEEPPESRLTYIDQVRKWIAAQHPDHRVGVICTEWGYSKTWEGFSDERQAEYYLREYLVGLMAGLDGTIIYQWNDDVSERGDSLRNFGIRDERHAPKSSYFAISQFVQKMNGYTLTGWTSRNDRYAMTFRKGMSRKVVSWLSTPHGATPGERWAAGMPQISPLP